MAVHLPFVHTHGPEATLEGQGRPAHATHPTRPFFHCITTLMNWDELERAVRTAWIPPAQSSGPVAMDKRTPPWMGAIRLRPCSARPQTIEALLEALRWFMDRRRAAVFVSIRHGRLRLFVPFVKERWRCRDAKWDLRDPLNLGRRLRVDEYVEAKKRATGRREEVLHDTTRWWTNGHVVCNVLPRDVWSDFHLAALHHMVMSACEGGESDMAPLPDVDLVLNKRDAPLLTKLFIPSAPPTTVEPLPTFSFYTGPAALDRPWPLPEDWTLAGRGPYPPAPAPPPPRYATVNRTTWKTREPVAVFRGSSTGAGLDARTNQRIGLVHMARSAPRELAAMLDVGITSWNTRDRIVAMPGGELVVTCPVTRDLERAYGTAERIPMAEQARRFRFAIYVAGQQAANRLGELMLAGFTILYVEPRADVLGPHTWLHDALVWAEWRSSARKLRPGANCLKVREDLSDLLDAVRWCRENDDMAMRIANAAQRFALTNLTTVRMVRYARRQIQSVATD